MKRDHVHKHVVWQALRVSIDRVESVGCKGGRDDPFMVWFVEMLVHRRPVKHSMNKIDHEIRKPEEEGGSAKAGMRKTGNAAFAEWVASQLTKLQCRRFHRLFHAQKESFQFLHT